MYIFSLFSQYFLYVLVLFIHYKHKNTGNQYLDEQAKLAIFSYFGIAVKI